MERVFPRNDEKIAPETRLLCGVAGSALLIAGLARRSPLRGLLALLGADLLTFGVTGHHVHEALGMASGHAGRSGTRIPHQLGVQVQRSIYVNAPPDKAYQFVRDLENLPRFMEHVKNVSAKDERRSHWVVKAPAGTQVEWDAEIINDLPGELIAWRSINNPDIDSAGSVHFEKSMRKPGTMIRVSMQYLPPAGILGATVARLFGEEPDQQLKDDLARLKMALESAA
jgi:uncharacterized membrane protein